MNIWPSWVIWSVQCYFPGSVFHILIFKEETFPMKKSCCIRFSDWLFEFNCGQKKTSNSLCNNLSFPSSFNHAYVEFLQRHFVCLLSKAWRGWEPLIIILFDFTREK